LELKRAGVWFDDYCSPTKQQYFTISRHAFTCGDFFISLHSPLFEIACVLVRLDHVASFIVKHGQHSVAPRNEIKNVMKEKLVMLLRHVVLFARNVGGKFGKVVREKLVTLSHRFVLFAPNVGRNRGNGNKGQLRPRFEWPYVMNSSAVGYGPLVSGTWIWHHQHARWHHGYYRTRR
jgi:hypothetical protein